MNKFVPKEITEEVNVTPVHPLVNLGYLMATVAVVGLAIYSGLGLVASHLATRIRPETEEQIGATMTSTLRLISDDSDSRINYLNELLAALQADVASTPLGNSQYPPLKVSILETEVENAMVSAGSYLFVTDGLLAAVDSENELAFVLAHELGHLHHRDPLKALGRSLVWVTMSSLIGLGEGPTSAALPSFLNLSELGHSRAQETAADDYAVALIMAHYQHGAHSLGFFERNQDLDPDWGALNSVAQWQQTHPLSRDRIQRIEATFVQKGWPLLGEATPLPENIACPNFEPCEP
ncbi:MAG: M48 family metallopeptidase [Phormidesmis sp.]